MFFSPGSGPTIAAGARVDVYYAYFDPASDSARGTITFDSAVLGIVAYTSQLQFSDSWRVSGAPYPGNPASVDRGWEDTESAMLSADRLTLDFSVDASSPGDQFRIFVNSAAIPEPLRRSKLDRTM